VAEGSDSVWLIGLFSNSIRTGLWVPSGLASWSEPGYWVVQWNILTQLFSWL